MSSHDFDRHLNLTRVSVRGLTISLWGFYTSLQRQLSSHLFYLSKCNSKLAHYTSFQMMILEDYLVAQAYMSMILIVKVILNIIISFYSPFFNCIQCLSCGLIFVSLFIGKLTDNLLLKGIT